MQGTFANIIDHAVVELFLEAYRLLEKANSDYEYDSRIIPKTYTGNSGRPAYQIPRSLIVSFFEAGFTQRDIGNIIRVSENTIAHEE